MQCNDTREIQKLDVRVFAKLISIFPVWGLSTLEVKNCESKKWLQVHLAGIETAQVVYNV